jgi:hypothetical protein
MEEVVIVTVLIVLAYLISWRAGVDEPVDGVDSGEGFFEENDSDKD